MAEELGEWYERIIRDNEKASVGGMDEWRRIERRHLDDAATDLMTEVSRLVAPVRLVVMMRASGAKWRDIYTASGKNRPFFSLKDDWRSGVLKLCSTAAEPITRLS
jgi:hypothetical protein